MDLTWRTMSVSYNEAVGTLKVRIKLQNVSDMSYLVFFINTSSILDCFRRPCFAISMMALSRQCLKLTVICWFIYPISTQSTTLTCNWSSARGTYGKHSERPTPDLNSRTHSITSPTAPYRFCVKPTTSKWTTSKWISRAEGSNAPTQLWKYTSARIPAGIFLSLTQAWPLYRISFSCKRPKA